MIRAQPGGFELHSRGLQKPVLRCRSICRTGSCERPERCARLPGCLHRCRHYHIVEKPQGASQSLVLDAGKGGCLQLSLLTQPEGGTRPRNSEAHGRPLPAQELPPLSLGAAQPSPTGGEGGPQSLSRRGLQVSSVGPPVLHLPLTSSPQGTLGPTRWSRRDPKAAAQGLLYLSPGSPTRIPVPAEGFSPARGFSVLQTVGQGEGSSLEMQAPRPMVATLMQESWFGAQCWPVSHQEMGPQTTDHAGG